MSALGPCALCGRYPAAGFASIGDDWYCHGDDDPEPTCYMRAQWPALSNWWLGESPHQPDPETT